MRTVAGAGLLLLAACARMEPPPGGPPDTEPPVLLAMRPDSLLVRPGFDGSVEFRFDETVSEGSTPSLGLGTGDLERLVILSPDSQVPVVSWKRSRITVRPRGGWQPGRTYRVELLPGLVDLRRNRLDSGAVVTFTTGGPVPSDTLRGRVGDWTTGGAARGALIEAILLPDSLAYRTVTDSTGRFAIGPLPEGAYLIRATLDGNRNLRHEPREPWDTLSAARAPADSSFLWAFPRDTLGPRLQAVAIRDSLTLDLTFNQVLQPAQAVPAESLRVLLLPDSILVPALTLLPAAVHDSLYRMPDTLAADPLAADTLPPRPARPDSIAAPAPPVPVRAPPRAAGPGREAPRPGVAPAGVDTTFRRTPLATGLRLRLGTALLPARAYLVEVRGIRNANGAAGVATLGFTTPAPPPAAPVDSLGGGLLPPAGPPSVNPP